MRVGRRPLSSCAKLHLAGAEQLCAGAQLGWRMVKEAAVTELTVLGAGWFAPPVAKQPKKVSAPVAAASVSTEERLRQATAELRAERAHSDEVRIELETSQLGLKRGLPREECAAVWAELQIKIMVQEHEVRAAQTQKQSPLLPSAHPSVPPLTRRRRRARFAPSTAPRRARRRKRTRRLRPSGSTRSTARRTRACSSCELVHKSRAAQQQDAASRRDAKADMDTMATRVRDLRLTPFLCRFRPFWRHLRHKASPRYLI